jgi:hypothetical protein
MGALGMKAKAIPLRSPEPSVAQSRTPCEEHPGPLGQLPTFPPQQSLEALIALVQAHGKEYGFAVKIRNRKPRKYGELVYLYCTKGGTYDDRGKNKVHATKRRKVTGSVKTDCQFRYSCTREGTTWTGKVVNQNHNHGPIDAISLPAHRRKALSEEQKLDIFHKMAG